MTVFLIVGIWCLSGICGAYLMWRIDNLGNGKYPKRIDALGWILVGLVIGPIALMIAGIDTLRAIVDGKLCISKEWWEKPL